MIRQEPYTGGEMDVLIGALDRHRDVVLWKLEGLDDEQVRRPMTPSGTSLLGLVKHLASVEYGWFCLSFGRPADMIELDPDDPDSDMRAEPHETTDDLVAYYRRAWAAANESIRELGLDAAGTHWRGFPVSMRWVVVHMIEDTVRHTGHMDILREQLDGATGHLRSD